MSVTAPNTPRPARPDGPPGIERREFEVVGHSVPRLDGVAKVTGQAAYASDLVVPGMAHAAIVRSPYAHAHIVRVDPSTALRRPGVIAVLTGGDVARLPSPIYGHAIADHPVLAIERVRFAGEPVAVVVAADALTAQEAVADVDVVYDELPAVLDVESAIAADAPLVHERRYAAGAYGGIYSAGAEEVGEGSRHRNVCHHTHLEQGDVDRAFREAAHVVEAEYRFPRIYAYAMEPYVAIADYRPNGLTIYSGSQHPSLVRTDLARIFGLPLSAVRLIVPYVGGGYGSRSYTKIEPLVSACSWKVRRPVKLQLDVEESILTTRVASAIMRLRTALDAEGRLLAREGTIFFDGGAYAENSPHGAHLSATNLLGPYRVPNFRVDSYLVYTNTAPASSFRGFSSTQPTFASEAQLDELADAAGIDRLALRLRNVVPHGERVHDPKARAFDGDVGGDLRLAATAIGWDAPRAANRGRGLATMMLAAGAHPLSTSQVRIHGDGSVSVLTGSTELGQGTETVLAQIAAEELGVPFSAVRVVRADTGVTPFERSTGASRSTTLQGRALMEACRDARERLAGMAAEAFGIAHDGLELVRGGLRSGDKSWTWAETINAYFGLPGCEVIGLGHVRKVGDLLEFPVFWEQSVAAVEVAVDPDTGVVHVEALATVGDVGLAIHPAMLEGQDLGAAVMGLGPAVFEELLYDGQQLANGSLLLYRVPRFSDVPRTPTLITVENRDGVGPYGAKGGGEGAVAPMGPAIAGAVHDATGVWIRTLPLTPERVWRALRDARAAAHPATSDARPAR